MGAVRIQTEFYTDQGVRYRINIWDSDWASATITSFDNNGFELEYDRCDRFLTPLIPSSCYCWIIDDGSSDFTAFKTDLANAQENEFKLYIEKYVSGAWVIDWAGVIMSDMVSWDNDSAPRYFEIIAKDGLNRLEGITFDKILTTPYTSQALQKISKIIFDCLSYAGTAQFWNGSSKPYMKVNLKKHDVLQTSVTQAQILDFIYIGREFLIDDSSKPLDGVTSYKFRGQYDEPLKAKDVLSQILQLFGLRILLSEGTWCIEEVTSFTISSDSFGEYNYLGSYTGAAAHTLKLTENGSTLAVLANGKYGYYPPVKLSRAKIYPSEILNGSFYLISGIYDTNTTFTSSTFDLGTVYGGTGLQLSININYDIRAWYQLIGKDFYVEVSVKLVLGSYRIKNRDTTDGYKGGEVYYTTTAADSYKYDIYQPYLQQNIKDSTRVITIQTPDIPVGTYSSSSLVVTATLKSISGTSTFPSKSYLNLFFNRVEISCLDTAKSPATYGQITELEYTNTNLADNSINIDYGFLRICDNLGQTAISDFNSIMVIQPNNAGALTRSTDWDAGYTTDVGLVETLLKETVALQATAIPKYNGNFRSTTYDAWNTIEYDSVIWAFMGGRYSAKMDEWSGEWFAISHDTSITIAATERVNDYKPDTFSPTSWHKDIPFANGYPVGAKPVVKINTGVALGTTGLTSFTIDSAEYDHIRAGDVVMLLDPVGLNNYQYFTVSANCEIGDTSLSVNSATLLKEVWQTYLFAHEPREIIASNLLRASKTIELGSSGNKEIHRILRATTSNSTITEATMDGDIAGAENRIFIPSGKAIGFFFNIVGKRDSSADCLYYQRRVLIKNNAATTTIEGSVETIGTDVESAGFTGLTSVTITANDTDDCLKFEVTGVSAMTIYWTIDCKGVLA